MTGFVEKLRLLEQRKKEYRQRLMALPEAQRGKVEDAVWAEASRLTAAVNVNTAKTHAFQIAQKGLSEAFHMIRSLDKKAEITPELLSDIHRTVVQDDPFNAGRYRRTAARWMNSTMIMSNWASIPFLVDKLCNGINNNTSLGFYDEEQTNEQLRTLSHQPVFRAIEACYSTVVTHPFSDANKRVARLGMAALLARANHIPMMIYNRQAFVKGAENYCHTHQPHNFVRTMIQQMNESYDYAFHALRHQERGGR